MYGTTCTVYMLRLYMCAAHAGTHVCVCMYMYMYTCSSEMGGGSCSSLVYPPSRAYRRLGLAEVLQLGLGVGAAEEAAPLAIEGQRARDERLPLQPILVR